MAKIVHRCGWSTQDPLYTQYHDEEWGVPVHDDRRLFEMLLLEGAQAGLSWITILRKRDSYRAAFDDFDPEKIAEYGPHRVAELLANPGIVRNRLKIEAAIGNARAYLDLVAREASLDRFVWSFVGGRPIERRPATLADIPAKTEEAEALSRALQARGFRFVGPTIIYAFMQATGLVNDHLATCFRAPPVRKSRTRKG